MTTIRDVAKAAGVSPATVSRVVNGLPGYSERTRERVEQAASDLDYQPDVLARGLKLRNSTIIGVLAPVVSDALASHIMAGVEMGARAQGHTVVLGRTGPRSRYAPGYLRSLRTSHAAGVILISAEITAEMRRALGPSVPFIGVAIRNGSRFPSLAIDDERAAYDGAMHLIGLGHRRIGLISGDVGSTLVNTPRVNGYRRAMRDAGLEPIIAEGDSLYESGPVAVRRLLDAAPDLSAVFALSDEMAVGAVNELQRLGIGVPERISVLGFDNTRTAEHVHPALTTVAQPLQRMGELAVEMLLTPGGVPARILPHTIVERASTAPPPA